jgi:hypothetical protein
MYVDRNSHMIRVETDVSIDLEIPIGETIVSGAVPCVSNTIWSAERLQSFVREKQMMDYSIECLLLYHIHLMPEQVQMYAKTGTDVNVKRFLKVFRYGSPPVFKDIIIPPAVSTFHDVHRIYLIFREKPDKTPRGTVVDRHPWGMKPGTKCRLLLPMRRKTLNVRPETTKYTRKHR